MTRKTMAPWLGALVATPALTVSMQPAAAGTAPAASSAAMSVAGDDSRAALRAGLLSLSLDEKLMIAGDRLGVDPLAVGASSPRPWGASAPRTTTDIPECQSPTGVKGSGAKGSKGHRMSALAKAGGGASGASGRTNTDIPECRGSGARTGVGALAMTTTCTVHDSKLGVAGSTKGGAAPRTNTDIPECRSPSALKLCGATKGGVAPRTNTDIPECRAPGAKCGASPGGHQMVTKAAITKGSPSH